MEQQTMLERKVANVVREKAFVFKRLEQQQKQHWQDDAVRGGADARYFCKALCSQRYGGGVVQNEARGHVARARRNVRDETSREW